MNEEPSDRVGGSVPEATEEAVLWRRIHPDKIVFDKNQNRWRPSSDSFKDNPNGTPMSVFDAAKCPGTSQVLSGHEEYLIAAIKASDVLKYGMSIVSKEAEGTGHCEVEGTKTKSIRSEWAKNSEWVVGPPRELLNNLETS